MKLNHHRKKGSSHTRKHKSWQIQEAKAKFSQLINETVSSGYQTITRNGEPVAYIVSKKEFDRCLKPQKSLLEVFDQCPYPEVDIDVERSKESIREIDLLLMP